jgi:MFS family permease
VPGRRPALAVAVFFGAFGFGFANWAARIPAVKSAHHLSSSHLGLVLFAVAGGALLSMPLTGAYAARAGSTRAVQVSALLFLAALAALPLSPGFLPLVGSALLFGVGIGAMNVALNAHGVAVERLAGRPILSRFHAAFSGGGLAGAGVGGLAAAAGIDPRAQLAVVAAGAAVILFLLAPALAAVPEVPQRAPRFARPQRNLLQLGAIAVCCLLAEGAAADWSAVFMHDSVGASAGVAAVGYFAFSGAMLAGRLSGDRLVVLLGPRTLVRAGAVAGAAGLAGALVARTTPAAVVGFVLLGAGLAGVVPTVLRAAANETPSSHASGVAAVSSLGWLGFLAGPPLIGAVASATSLPVGLLLVVVSVASIALLAGALRSNVVQTGRVAVQSSA